MSKGNLKTYHLLPILSVHLLLPDHFLYAAVFHHLLLLLSSYYHAVLIRLLLQSLRLVHLSKLFQLVLFHYRAPSLFFLHVILIESLFFFLLSISPHIVTSLTILIISLPDLHDLLGLTLSLLDFLPGLLLFHFEESDPIGQQLSVICCLFLIGPSFLECSSYFIWIFFLVVLLIVVVLLLSFLVIIHHSAVVILLDWLLLHLWYWLVFLWRFDRLNLISSAIHF